MISDREYALIKMYFSNNEIKAQNAVIQKSKIDLDKIVKIQKEKENPVKPTPPKIPTPQPSPVKPPDLPEIIKPSQLEPDRITDTGTGEYSTDNNSLNMASLNNTINMFTFQADEVKAEFERKLIEDVRRNPRKYILNPHLITGDLSENTLKTIEEILRKEKQRIENIVTLENENIESTVNNIVFTGDEENSNYILFNDSYSHIGDYNNFIEEVIDASTKKDFKSKRYYEEKYKEYKEKYENTLAYKKKNEDELEGYRNQLEKLADKFYDNLPDYLLSHFSWLAQTISMIGLLNGESLSKFAESLTNISISDITDYVFGAGDLNEQWKYVNELTLKARPIESSIRRLVAEINSVENILKEYKTQMEFYYRCYLLTE